jgi:excisionase family DNA binding protein
MNELQVVTVSKPQLLEIINRGLQEQFSEFKKELKEKLEDRLLTREETAKYLSISISTLSKWKANGTLDSYALGGRVYYKLSSIQKALIKLN